MTKQSTKSTDLSKINHRIMKTILSLLMYAFTVSTAMAQVSGALAIGASIPLADTKLKAGSGQEVSIKDEMKKNGVLVMFSCNTCPYVVKYQSRTLEISKEATRRNIGVIIINSNEENRSDEDSYNAMKAYAKKQGYTVPYVVDTKSVLADAFGATRTPECFLFNADGKLIYHGAIDDNQNAAQVGRKHLLTAIDESLASKQISINETRSIGCMIKRLE